MPDCYCESFSLLYAANNLMFLQELSKIKIAVQEAAMPAGIKPGSSAPTVWTAGEIRLEKAIRAEVWSPQLDTVHNMVESVLMMSSEQRLLHPTMISDKGTLTQGMRHGMTSDKS